MQAVAESPFDRAWRRMEARMQAGPVASAQIFPPRVNPFSASKVSGAVKGNSYDTTCRQQDNAYAKEESEPISAVPGYPSTQLQQKPQVAVETGRAVDALKDLRERIGKMQRMVAERQAMHERFAIDRSFTPPPAPTLTPEPVADAKTEPEEEIEVDFIIPVDSFVDAEDEQWDADPEAPSDSPV
ncbi:hypothetical protein BOTBODRAFT_147471 [Botryobasidium botryosum FD-172 SS1]|uniref:Uncharacterized protein n=1 Tax=Botryobasidium botryosum (strain FD-172 SS1) TaxID=930990 RepID=A0A067M5H2_BOTB1|nr:hypothetical protein BOTBODRAFT_147471 [Botryobasidium botryosum FD-172 SS1]